MIVTIVINDSNDDNDGAGPDDGVRARHHLWHHRHRGGWHPSRLRLQGAYPGDWRHLTLHSSPSTCNIYTSDYS